MGWFCLLQWGSEVSPGTDAAHMGRWVGTRSRSQIHGTGIPELEAGPQECGCYPAPLGVKGAQAIFSRFLGTGASIGHLLVCLL